MKLILETENGVRTLASGIPDGSKYEECLEEMVNKAAMRAHILYHADLMRGVFPPGSCARVLRAEEYQRGDPMIGKIGIIEKITDDRIWIWLESGYPITLTPGKCSLELIGHCNLDESMWQVDYDFDCEVVFSRDYCAEEKDDLFHRIEKARQDLIDNERDFYYMFA